MKTNKFLLVPVVLLLIASCKPDEKTSNYPQPNTPATANVTIKINHTFGTQALDFTSTVQNPADNAEDIKFSSLQYILSNFKLQDKDGNWQDVPETYFYINQSDANSLKITLKDVKVQEYKSIRFLIGVDSARNTSGAQTGGLDPATGMFWSWNSGYIFFKLEGNSSKLSPTKFEYHIGGFKGAYNALVWVDAPFGSKNLTVKDGANTIKLQGNVKAVFENPGLKLATMSLVNMAGPQAKTISASYADMFSVTGIE